MRTTPAATVPGSRAVPRGARSRNGRLGARRHHGAVLVVVHADDLVEAGQLEDLPVVLGQAVGAQLLVGTLGADEQRDQQADAAAVHVVQAGEVQDDPAGLLRARLAVGVHELVLARRRDVALELDDRHRAPRGPDVCVELGARHGLSPSGRTHVAAGTSPTALGSSSWMWMKSDSRVTEKISR